jgi:DNA-directed RNA polymerase subunit beta
LAVRLAARVLRTWTEDFVDEDTGEVVSIDRNEVLLERDSVIELKMTLMLSLILGQIHYPAREDININDYPLFTIPFRKTTQLRKRSSRTNIPSARNTEAPDEQTARDIIQSLFFSDKRYDLGEVGVYRINKKLGLAIDSDVRCSPKRISYKL